MAKKLVVTVPAYNEQETIAGVIAEIPKKIGGISKIEVLVVDDGSEDKTAKRAKQAGAKVFINKVHVGLARTFAVAVEKALEDNADIIVNIDADNQYEASEIPKIAKPIIDGKADMVVGDRRVKNLKFMPPTKKYGNLLGSYILRLFTRTNVRDASSGFRAFSRSCAKKFNILSGHTYAHETIIQAANQGFVIASLPVKFRQRALGKSRLITNIWVHIREASLTIIRTTLMYKAFGVLVSAGLAIISAGVLGIIRFIYFFFTGEGAGHIQSLIISSILISLGFTTIVMGLLADLIAINRKMIEKANEKK